MSFLGLGGSPNVSSQAKIQAAEAELDMVTGMFNQLVDICQKKCIGTSYNSSDLDKNESLCVDRCVAKYFDTNLKVGDSMQKVGQNGAFGVNR